MLSTFCLYTVAMFYHIKSEEVALAKRIARTGLIFALTLLGMFLIHRFWFAQNAGTLWEQIFDALVAAGTFFFFDSQRREYDIEVTDDMISMQGGLFSRIRRVRRGHIHFLRELHGNIFREPALRLSEHGIIYRFLFGYVRIPAGMPDYEQIKGKATSWMHIG
jgi:hypothetical protein